MPDRHADHRDLAGAARAFIAAAFESLATDHVIPTPRFHPFVNVGVDYYGPNIAGLGAYDDLEQALRASFPGRFDRPLEAANPEFASAYIFSLLESAIARCSSASDYSIDGEPVDRAIEELISVLGADEHEIVCCRVVCHLTTRDNQPTTIGDITVYPEIDGPRSFERIIPAHIPGAAASFKRDPPLAYGPPHSLLVNRGATSGNPSEVVAHLSASLDRFALSGHLLAGWTIQTGYQVHGPATLVSGTSPQLSMVRGLTFPRMVHRTAVVDSSDEQALTAIQDLVLNANVKRDGMAATSFDTALSNFHRAHRGDPAFETLVDLATALEATLTSGESENEGLTARLRQRAAALLATASDSATAIYSDVGMLYDLRSKLVHGGHVKRRHLERLVGRVSTCPPDAQRLLGIGMEHAVDRMRDLVRRAILARLCLAAGDAPLWPFHGEAVSVDGLLADDATRTKWRESWRTRLAGVGAARAAEPAKPLLDILSAQRQA